MFLSAFMWEGFGIASGYSIESTKYYFITGFGGGVGTIVGHVLVYAIIKGRDLSFLEELATGTLYGLSAFLGPSTIWQKVVNDTAEWGWSFTAAFFFMWLVSGLIFYANMIVFRVIAVIGSKYSNVLKIVEPAGQRLWSDLSLSISVGLGDAFFMGTDKVQFQDSNWLAPAFGTNENTEPFEAMMKAGTSVMLGFLIMQIVENIVFRLVWTDDVQENANTHGDAIRMTQTDTSPVETSNCDVEVALNVLH